MITTTFANLPDGLQLMALFDQAFAEAANGVIGEPTVVTTSSAITAGTPAVMVYRTGPVSTTLTLPSAAAQAGQPLRIFDWSESITEHVITIVPHGTDTIMRYASYPIVSNESNRAGITLIPFSITSPAVIAGWYIVP